MSAIPDEDHSVAAGSLSESGRVTMAR